MPSRIDDVAALLLCPTCRSSSWSATGDAAHGQLLCGTCGARYACSDGVLDLGDDEEDRRVGLERAAVRQTERDPGLGGINDEFEDLSRAEGALRDAILALPHGDGSRYYQEPGYFQNVRASVPAVDYVAEHLRPQRGERLLDVGADLTWSTCLMARRGLDCTALDINHHLSVARLLQTHFGVSYRAVRADMNRASFRDGIFDVVLAVNALHHSGDLNAMAGNLARVLAPGGRLGFIEPYCATQEEKQAFGRTQIDAGISEQTYLLQEWHEAFVRAGLVLRHLRVSDSFSAIYVKPDPTTGGTTGDDADRDDLYGRFYDSRLEIAGQPPAEVRAGESFEVRLSVENRGNATWCANSRFPVHASYHMYRRDWIGRLRLIAFDNPRTELPAELRPGHAATVALRITAPPGPGAYVTSIDLVHEQVSWFAQRGLATRRVPFRVR